MKSVFGAFAVLIFIGGVSFFSGSRDISLNSNESFGVEEAHVATEETELLPASSSPTATSQEKEEVVLRALPGSDLPNQPQLENPPNFIKAIYVTGWSAGTRSRMESLINFAKQNGINAMIVDIKDYSGLVSYRMDIPLVKSSGADREPRIARPNALIAELHKNNIYVIGRVTVFQDPVLAKAHPEWALGDKTTGGIWKDNKGLAWMDPATKEVWDYNIAIAKDALLRGFDEINFDYIRFASDGVLGNVTYPSWDQSTSRSKVIANFFRYLRLNLEGAKISADLFGLVTVNRDDLGIGQVIEDAYPYFDYVAPMVYPSHYASGFLGYKNPAEHPYEVIHYSMKNAFERLLTYAYSKTGTSSSSTPKFAAKLRPWIQVFDLGARYDNAKIRAQIDGARDAIVNNTSTTNGAQYYNGWMLWDPKNIYADAKGIGL